MRLALVLTVLLLSAVALTIWIGRPEAAAHAAFGEVGSSAVLVLAMVAAIAGAILGSSAATAALRWILAAVLAGLTVLTVVLAFGHFAQSEGAPETVLGVFLVIVAFALAGIAFRLVRRP